MLDPRTLDLQLLVALDVLLEDPHVTRASRKLRMSQPALSHALNRMRRLFGDPLFVRTTKGLTPTARALALRGPVKNALREVEKIFTAHGAFDPGTSRSSFVIRMGDMNELLILPSVMRALQLRAPNMSITVKHLPPVETVRALDADEIALAISAELEHPKSIRSKVLLHDEMVCIMRKDHPAARQPLTLKTFLRLKHIKMAQTTSDMRLVDGYLAQDVAREVRLNIPHWLVAPAIVESTDLVTAISRRMSAIVNFDSRFVVRPLPMGPREFAWRLYWHARYDADPAHSWLRDLIYQACFSLPQPKAGPNDR